MANTADDIALDAGSPTAAPAEDVDEGKREALRGWALKKKSDGRASRFLGATNRRFYTIDFSSRVMYYGHSEDSKSVSTPVPFHHLVKVEPTSSMAPPPDADLPPAQLQESAESVPAMVRSDSKGSLASRASGSRLPIRMPSLSALTRRPSEQFGLILTSTNKSTELFFSDKSEADKWVEALREAIMIGAPARHGLEADDADVVVPEPSTAPGSSSGTGTPTPRSVDANDGDASCPQSSRGSGSPKAHGAMAQPDPEQVGEVLSGRGSKAEAPASPPATMTAATAAFAAAPELSEAPGVADGDQSPTCASPSKREVRSLGSTGAAELPRGGSAWGFGGDDDEARQSEANSRATRLYSDKGAGLSLQERLAQLEFSDDEDDDENDPTAAARKPSARTRQERAERGHGPSPKGVAAQEPEVVVEACEAFVPEPGSDDDSESGV